MATLLFDSEQVERCSECGTLSSASLSGRDNWVTVRVRPGHMLLVEVCAECYAQRHPPIRKFRP